MNERLFRAVQAALLARWDGKLSEILVCAKNFATGGTAKLRSTSESIREAETEKAIRDAYMAGYRQAYWDGIVDFVEATTEAQQPVPTQINYLEDFVH